MPMSVFNRNHAANCAANKVSTNPPQDVHRFMVRLVHENHLPYRDHGQHTTPKNPAARPGTW
eukprot:3620930-Prorocentrum_lima.AAC.1